LTFSDKYDKFVFTGENMIAKDITYLDTLYISDQLKEYASPKSKLTTMIQSGELIKIKRGLYIPGDRKGYSVKTLANKIYGPSYISFESALAYHGVIPESVVNITSAVYNKNKDKTFHTQVGTYIYRYVNPRTYPVGIMQITEHGSPFLIATKEKALCDTLSKITGIETQNQLNSLLENDLRIDTASLDSLSREDVSFLEPLYKKKIITLFKAFLERKNTDA